MADPIAEWKEWIATLRTLMKDRESLVKQRLEQHLIATGRAGDLANPDAVSREANRAKREDLVQNFVVDRIEISANVSYLETHATTPDAQRAQATQNVIDATTARDALLTGTQALTTAQTELNRATNQVAGVTAKTQVVKNLRMPGGAAALTVATQIAAVRNAELDPTKRDAAEAAHYKKIAQPLLDRENPGAAHTADELKSRAKQRLLDLEVEKIVSKAIADRINSEVDQLDGNGIPLRIVHPMTRVQEIEKIVSEVAAVYGFTNLAHFISRHGARRENPDTGKTTLTIPADPLNDPVTLAASDATTPQTTRTADDAAARVVTGVPTDAAVYGATRPANTERLGVAVSNSGDPTQPGYTETVKVPNYASVGTQAKPKSSQHASAKAALFMLEEAAAEAARAQALNKDAQRHTLNVTTGKEIVGGTELGKYAEPGGLGEAYVMSNAGLTNPQKNPHAGAALPQTTIDARLARLSKTVNAASGKITLLADGTHGGFTPMTMMSVGAGTPLRVDDDAAAKAAKDRVLAATIAGNAGLGTNDLRTRAAKFAAEVAERFAKSLALGAAVDPIAARFQAEIDVRKAFADAADPTDTSANGLELITRAATLAGTEVFNIATAHLAKRNKQLEQARLQEAAARATLSTRATDKRDAAKLSEAGRQNAAIGATQAFTDAMASLPSSADKPALQAELLSLAGAAAKDEAARLLAEQAAAAAAKAQAGADARAPQAVALAEGRVIQADAAFTAVQTEQATAVATLKRMNEAVAAAGPNPPPRLTEAVAAADARLLEKDIQLRETALAWADAEASRQLSAAYAAVSMARKKHEAALAQLKQGQALPHPSEALVQALQLSAAKVQAEGEALAQRRGERDAAQQQLVEKLSASNPARVDEADLAADASALAQTALADAAKAAAQSKTGMETRLTEAFPGDTAVAKARLASFVGASALALNDDVAAKKAEADLAEEVDKPDFARALNVRASSEATVLAQELAEDSIKLGRRATESLPDYEARLAGHGELITKQHAADELDLTKLKSDHSQKLDTALDTTKGKLADATQRLTEQKNRRANLEAQFDLREQKRAETVAQARTAEQTFKIQAAEQELAAEADQIKADEAASEASAAKLKAEQLKTTPSPEAQAKASLASEAKARTIAKAKEAQTHADLRAGIEIKQTAAKLEVARDQGGVTAAKSTAGSAEQALQAKANEVAQQVSAAESRISALKEEAAQQQAQLDQLAQSVATANDKLDQENTGDLPKGPKLAAAGETLLEFLSIRQRIETEQAETARQINAVQKDLLPLQGQRSTLDTQVQAARQAAIEKAQALLLESEKRLKEQQGDLIRHAATAETLVKSLLDLQIEDKQLADEAEALRAAELRAADEVAGQKKGAAEVAQQIAEASAAHPALTLAKATEASKAADIAEAQAVPLAEERTSSIDSADDEIKAAAKSEAAATKWAAEVPKVGDRIAAELASRQAVGAAHATRATADAAARLAKAKALESPGDAQLQAASVKAEHLLKLATKKAEQEEAAAALKTAQLELKTAHTRYAAGLKSKTDAEAKALIDRTELEKKLIAGWAAVELRLKAPRTKAEAAVAAAQNSFDLVEAEVGVLEVSIPP